MAEDAVAGQRHLGLVDDEMPVLLADRLLGLPATEIRQRAPALGVHHLGVAVGLVDIVAHAQGAAVLGRVAAAGRHVALVQHVFGRRAKQGDVHAHAGRDQERRVRHRRIEGLGMVGPGQHVLAPAQLAEAFAHRHRMGEFLARMGDGLEIDHRHRGVAREGLDDEVFAIHRPVDEFRERAHADQVAVARQHARDFGHVFLGLAVHHLARFELDAPGILARCQHDGVPAELPGADLEGTARAHRGVEEQQRDGAPGEVAAELVALVARRLRQQLVELGAGAVLGAEEVPDVHRFRRSKKRKSPAPGWASRRSMQRQTTTQPGFRPGVGARARSCRRPCGRWSGFRHRSSGSSRPH